jgi:hypothetical protein
MERKSLGTLWPEVDAAFSHSTAQVGASGRQRARLVDIISS